MGRRAEAKPRYFSFSEERPAFFRSESRGWKVIALSREKEGTEKGNKWRVGCSPAGRRAGKQAECQSPCASKYVAAVCSLSICGRKRSARVYARVPGWVRGPPRTLGHPSGPFATDPGSLAVPPGNVRAPPSGWLYYWFFRPVPLNYRESLSLLCGRSRRRQCTTPWQRRRGKRDAARDGDAAARLLYGMIRG